MQKIAFWATSTLIFCLFICGIASAWPTNVLSDSQVTKSIKEIFAETFPQGWSYFTKSSQELKAGVYDGATAESLLATPQARRENLYGISRDQRAQGPEIAMLVANTDLEWEECSGISQDCLLEASQRSPVRVDNIARKISLCGNIILTSETITPWLYRDFEQSGDLRIQSTAHAMVVCDTEKWDNG